MRFEYTEAELAQPFRDPLSEDAVGRGEIAVADLYPPSWKILAEYTGNAMIYLVICAVFAVGLSLVQAVISRTFRALAFRPCGEISQSCMNAWVDAALNLKGFGAEGYVAMVRGPITFVVTCIFAVLLIGTAWNLVRGWVRWLEALDSQDCSPMVMRLQQGLIDPRSSVWRKASTHAGIAAMLATAAIASLLFLDLNELKALALEAPDYAAEVHRLRFYKAMPLAACVMIGWYVIPNCILLLRDSFGCLMSRQPEKLMRRSQREDVTEPSIRIAHWSDLHLTAVNSLTLEGHKGGNEALRALIDRYEELLSSVDVLLVTGDMTDAGLVAEWHEFFQIMPEHLLRKVVLVPGNHDINIVSHVQRTAFESNAQVGFKSRLVRFLAVLDAVQGTRARVCGARSGLMPIRAFLREKRFALNNFADRGRGYGVVEAWQQCFPMAVDVPDSPFTIVIFDSIAPSRNLAANSFGCVTRRQLNDLRRLADAQPARRLIFALHHHVALPPISLRGNLLLALQQFFLVLQNARSVLETLRNFGPAVVLHGHRHVGFEGSIRDLEVVSARSTTLGCEFRQEQNPGFLIVEIGCRGTGSAVKSTTAYAL